MVVSFAAVRKVVIREEARVRLVYGVVVLGAAGFLTACGSEAAVSPAPTGMCVRAPGWPITLREMRTSLRSAGVAASEDASLCDRDSVAVLVDPNYDVSCTVYRRVVYPKFAAHPRMRFEGMNYSGKAYVVAFANVDCWIYAEGSQRAQTTADLRRIFRRFGATSSKVGRY
jgi:hypothetical protein